MQTIDYTRQRDIFDPNAINATVTVVGCGGIGSFAAFALAKLGVRELRLVDFDTVGAENIPNQLFTPDQIGELKVHALTDTLRDIAECRWTIDHYPQPLQDGIPLSPVVISALDSMQARAELWTQVRYKLACSLFLDGRIGGQNVVLYAVRPSDPADVAGYESTLHSDDEGLDLPCTARAVIDVGFAMASLITRAVRRFYAREDREPMLFLNQATAELHRGGWPND